MILALVGVSEGVLGEMQQRAKGVGADILVRAPDSSGISMRLTNQEEAVDLIRRQPHVAMATGTYVKSIASFDSITGIHLDEFNAISGGLKYVAGGPFRDPDDIVIDETLAKTKN